jgi:hypothetical protein
VLLPTPERLALPKPPLYPPLLTSLWPDYLIPFRSIFSSCPLWSEPALFTHLCFLVSGLIIFSLLDRRFFPLWRCQISAPDGTAPPSPLLYPSLLPIPWLDYLFFLVDRRFFRLPGGGSCPPPSGWPRLPCRRPLCTASCIQQTCTLCGKT